MNYRFFILLFLVSLFYNTIAQKAYVVSISDGDSFKVLFEDKHQEKIRMHGIDCPEKGQPYYQVAKQYTANKIFRKQITLKILYKDRYGRSVALVYLADSILLNERLLSAGLAWHYLQFDKNPKWQLLQNTAKQKGMGLWADKNPIAPWLWRKK